MRDTGLSASDVALLSGRNNDGAFGDGNAWWVIIFIIFAFMGWGNNGFGRNGFGNNGSGSSGNVADGYVLASDFANISRQIDSTAATTERKLDSISNGICDSTFALNNTINSGFTGVQQTLCQGFNGINQGIITSGYETRNAIQGVSSQLSGCCCDNLRAIDGVNYNMATNTCSINNTIQNTSRDTIDAINGVYRSLHDEIVANRIEDKNAQIQAQQNQITALQLAASQERQNNYLIEQLKPCPIPAYITCNPYQSASCNCNCSGY